MKRYPKAVRLPSGSYRCQVMKDGKRYSFTADDPATAITRAVEFRDGAYKKTPRGVTLGACIEEYILFREAVLSPSTIAAYKSYLSHRFQAYMNRNIEDLDSRTLQRMVNEEARQVSPKTVKNAFGLITAALGEYSISTAGVNLPQIPHHERPWLTADEVLTFCKVVKGKQCEIPALLALCSLRRSEIVALEWKDVDLKAKTIRVRRSMVKGEGGFVTKDTNKTDSSTRTVPIIIPQLVDALKAQKGKSGRIVQGYPNSMYSQINRLCEAAGLPQVGVHGLRHSFASLCHYLGIPEMECARMGGWSDLGTMRKIYTHISESQLTDAAARLISHFEMG